MATELNDLTFIVDDLHEEMKPIPGFVGEEFFVSYLKRTGLDTDFDRYIVVGRNGVYSSYEDGAMSAPPEMGIELTPDFQRFARYTKQPFLEILDAVVGALSRITPNRFQPWQPDVAEPIDPQEFYLGRLVPDIQDTPYAGRTLVVVDHVLADTLLSRVDVQPEVYRLNN